MTFPLGERLNTYDWTQKLMIFFQSPQMVVIKLFPKKPQQNGNFIISQKNKRFGVESLVFSLLPI
jgi:hypothetical protein